MLAMTSVWILVWSGYIGVDGVKFSSQKFCQEYAELRIANLEPKPKEWYCVEEISK